MYSRDYDYLSLPSLLFLAVRVDVRARAGRFRRHPDFRRECTYEPHNDDDQGISDALASSLQERSKQQEEKAHNVI